MVLRVDYIPTTIREMDLARAIFIGKLGKGAGYVLGVSCIRIGLDDHRGQEGGQVCSCLLLG